MGLGQFIARFKIELTVFLFAALVGAVVIMPSSAVQMEARSPRSLFLNGAVKRKFDEQAANGTSWEHESKQKVRPVGDLERCGVYNILVS